MRRIETAVAYLDIEAMCDEVVKKFMKVGMGMIAEPVERILIVQIIPRNECWWIP